MVTINYVNKNNKKIYTEGEKVEKDLYYYIKRKKNYLDIISEDDRWTVFYHLTELRKGILSWYPFKKNASCLEIGAGLGAITGLLCDKCNNVTAVELSEIRAKTLYERYKDIDNLNIIVGDIFEMNISEKFDYITLIGVLEYQGRYIKNDDNKNPYVEFIKKIKTLLKPDGKLLIAIENRFGLKYWCGTPEDHSGKVFDGINGYKKSQTAITFGKKELTNIIERAGFKNYKFFYPMPDYKLPNMIFSDAYFPKQDINNRYREYFLDYRGLVLEEQRILPDIIDNNVFPFFSNSFFIECTDNKCCEVKYATMTYDRKKDYQTATIIYDKYVEKKSLNKIAVRSIRNIKANFEYLKNKEINIIDYKYNNGKITMPYMKYESFDNYLLRIVKSNIKMFFKEIERFYKELLKSSEFSNKINDNLIEIDNIVKCPILKKGFIDFLFHNSFNIENKIVVFDQQFCESNIPANFMIYRSVKNLYYNNSWLEDIIPIKDVYEKYNINQCEKVYEDFDNKLLNDLFEKSTAKVMNKYRYYSKELLNANQDYLLELNELSNFKKNYDYNLQGLSKSNEELNSINHTLSKSNEELNSINCMLSNANEELLKNNNKLLEEVEQQRKEIECIKDSNSWKITKPLRNIRAVLKKIKTDSKCSDNKIRSSKINYFILCIISLLMTFIINNVIFKLKKFIIIFLLTFICLLFTKGLFILFRRIKNKRSIFVIIKYIFSSLLLAIVSVHFRKFDYFIFGSIDILNIFFLSNLLLEKKTIIGNIINDILLLLFNVQLIILYFSSTYLTRILLTNINLLQDLGGKIFIYLSAIYVIVIISIIPVINIKKKSKANIIGFTIGLIIWIICSKMISISTSPLGGYINLLKEEINYIELVKKNKKHNEAIKKEFHSTVIKDYKTKPNNLKTNPNIILIFTEGLSKNIINDSRNIMPNVKELANKSIDFTGYYNHTFATFRGIIGQLYSGFQLNNEDTNKLIPINKILQDNGYYTSFINTEPTGKMFNEYLESFGFNEVTGAIDEYEGVINSISDKQAYELLYDKAISLNDDDNSFLISIYTFGTHISFDTVNEKYGKGKNILLNRFYNCDYQFGKFLEKFETSELSNNTIIIFTTDHASYMDSDYVNTFANVYSRVHEGLDEIPLYIYHKDIEPDKIEVNGRTSLDLAPTILDYLDISGENYFLGESLFSGADKGTNYDYYFFDGTNFAKSSNKIISGLTTDQDKENIKHIKDYLSLARK